MASLTIGPSPTSPVRRYKVISERARMTSIAALVNRRHSWEITTLQGQEITIPCSTLTIRTIMPAHSIKYTRRILSKTKSILTQTAKREKWQTMHTPTQRRNRRGAHPVWTLNQTPPIWTSTAGDQDSSKISSSKPCHNSKVVSKGILYSSEDQVLMEVSNLSTIISNHAKTPKSQ